LGDDLGLAGTGTSDNLQRLAEASDRFRLRGGVCPHIPATALAAANLRRGDPLKRAYNSPASQSASAHSVAEAFEEQRGRLVAVA
jgi:hypothetical protein